MHQHLDKVLVSFWLLRNIPYFSAATTVEMGDTSERKRLVEELQCHDFQWFVDYVYPDSPFPNHHNYFGTVRHYPNTSI